MNRFSESAGLLRATLVAVALLWCGTCAARDTIVRVGVPHAYETQIPQQSAAPPRCPDRASACSDALGYRYAVGTDYQLLDWLQNGKIDAAVVSRLTVELIRRGADGKFNRDFWVADSLPLSTLQLRRTRVALQVQKGGTAPGDAEAELATLFHDLLARRTREDATIEVSSHLSSGIPELFARAERWLKSQPGRGADALDTLMDGLLQRLRFSFDGSPRGELRFTLLEEEGTTPELFLARRSALPEWISARESVQLAPAPEAAFLKYLGDSNKAEAPTTELTRFAAANYVRDSIGWRTRYLFAFTLQEVYGLLRHEARDPAEDDGIALVLTGGGVKAAYQTKLIDHLYRDGFLRNHFSSEKHASDAVPVKYVVGTSGGALLGIFVASLDGNDPKLDLSTKLWSRYAGGKPDGLLSSGDIFPKVDMLRWLSLLACMVIFGVVCWALSHIRRWRGDLPSAPSDGPGRFWRLSFWWLLLLAVTPWLLIYVNGDHGQEHIPAIQGVFYFVYVLIAIHSDNRFVTTRERRAVDASPWPPLGLVAAGVTLVAIGVWLRGHEPLEVSNDVQITPSALLACVGVLLVFWGAHWWLLRRAWWLRPVKPRTLSAFAMLIGVCALSYLPILLSGAPSLELTLEFWKWLAASALIVSLALAALSTRGRPRFLKDFFDFLLSRHPAQQSGSGRHVRIIWGFVVGWFWWNLAVAPGAYGNDNARGYFKAAARNVFGEEKVQGESLRDVQFRAFYVAPITALREGLERYVMFQPRESYQTGARGALPGERRNWASLSNDPRWFTIESDEQQADLVLRVAFASGSPFPVFPPHRLPLQSKNKQELYVDGGYAHNVPVEAAKRLGARRVLVISSSPRSRRAVTNGLDSKFQPLGDFAWMLRWIVPYLYERSQVEDALSAEDLLVASIAPSASAEDWPFLTDFRDKVIERMFEVAQRDIKRRVGRIENWGQPSFRDGLPRP